MASFEKLSKGLEALKMSITSGPPPGESALRSKDKVSLCILVTDLICSSELKVSSNFNHHLSGSMETLFLMCDDQDSNVRMVADECLNRIIRSLMDGHIAKVNVELHAEIKKNRNARSLRAALTKFGELAQTIRPNKRKVYMQNLVEHIKAIAKRQEESVLETLATSLGKFLVPLGCFLLDSETKDLLQIFMKNIGSENAVFRRTAASSILAICLNCRKSQFFIVHTINTLLESVLPVKEDQNLYTILGVLNCIRGLLSHLEEQGTETGLRGSFGQKRKQKKEFALSLDSMIQVFELCLHWSQHQDHNIVTAALETLNELLTSLPSQLVPILLSHQGLSRSRIHSSNVGWRLSSKTLSDISVATAVPLTEDLNFLGPEDLLPHNSILSGWLEDSGVPGSQVSISNVIDRSGPASINQDSVSDYPDSESVMSDDLGPPPPQSMTSATPENDLDLSRESPSPPPDSLHPLAWDIGELTDCNQSPLLFTGRRLVTSFLIPECGSIRVSVRSLALTCLTQVIKLLPSIFLQQVDKNGLSTPKGFSHICDVLCFSTHPDQQLRGLIRPLIGHLIHSSFSLANYGPQYPCESSDKTLALEELIQTLMTGTLDESSVCVRHSLSALGVCLPDILESKHYTYAGNILDKLLSVVQNPYWLVKVKLIELFCSLPFQSVFYLKGCMDYQAKVFDLIIHEFLANEDNRVRKTTCDGIVKIIMNLHFTVDYGVDDVVVTRGLTLTSKMISRPYKPGSTDNLPQDIILESTLTRVVDRIVEAMMLSSSKHLSLGCIEALCCLSNNYAPSRYPLAWQCSDSESSQHSPSGGFFSIIVQLLVKSPLSLDLECHQCLLKLASNLFIGLVPSVDKHHELFSAENSKLKASIDEVLAHTMRLMYIFSRVMEDTVPARNFLSSPLKKRPPRPSSPSKNHTPEKEGEKEVKVRLIGVFGSSSHYQKLLEGVRSGYTNYKLTLDRGASEKFLSLIRQTLECLEVMLSPNKIIDTENIFEELLQYLRVTFLLDSAGTVKVVYQLLRSLFETNLLGVKTLGQEAEIQPSEKTLLVNGFYNNVFQSPLFQLAEQCNRSNSGTDTSRHMENEEKETGKLSQSERETLASRIKLFEGIVIQSLKEYTLTCNIALQAQVLRLLTLLVQLKVNYCLLDSDHVFINFVLKQFEYLEAGQIQNAEVLIPSIFQFLVYLSNEKNHSKPVISMPKIIQLCDGLMASGQNPLTHSIPALLPVVGHVFFRSTSAPDQKEIETQMEYLLSMLLRLAEYPKVLETVHELLSTGWRWEEHWGRWYQQAVDAIVPLLAEGRLPTSDLSLLHSIFTLNEKYFAPLSTVLTLLFTPQQEGQTVSQWLGMVAVMLLSLSTYQEAEVLGQLEQMNLYVREEGDDPLKVRTVSKTLAPQCLLAKLLLRTILNSSSKMKILILSPHKDESVSDLGKTFSNFLLCCIFMLQPDRFVMLSRSLKALLENSSDLGCLQESICVISRQCQVPALLWLQLESLLDLSVHQFSASFLPLKSQEVSLNDELLRRGTIMIYAEYLSKRPQDHDALQWFLTNHNEDVIWHCHETPIEMLLTSIYNSVPNSQVLLNSSSSCMKKMETVFIHRLLHTLEYIHTDLSGTVLKLVALSLIEYTNLAIARLAAAFCCRTVEFILSSDNPIVKKQLAEEDLRYIFASLSSNQRQFKRHNNLIILLNKLGKQNYNISLCEFDDCVKPVSSELVRSIQLNKSWFFTLVSDKCSRISDCDTRKCAYLLSKLDYKDIENIMSSKEFNLRILEYCFSSEKGFSPEFAERGFSYNFHNLPIYKCAKENLLKKIKEIYQELPSKYEIFDPSESMNHELFQILASKDFMETLLSVIPALKNLLYSLENPYEKCEPFEKEESIILSRFGVFCAEVINWIIFQMPRHELKPWPSIVQSLLECSAAVFKIDCLSTLLTFEQISSICSSLMNIFMFVSGENIPLKEYKPLEENTTKESSVVLKTALQMVSVISIVETNPGSIPKFIFVSAKSLVVSLGRNQKLNWLCRIPIEVWQPPLDSPTPPSIPTHVFHDSEVLSQIVLRIHLLGWRGKFQFEESWVCLLGALSPNPDIDNTEQEEISAIMHANSLAVDGITRLVISTLGRCTPSETKYLHVPRHSNEKLVKLKCWIRLAEMNDIICSKLERISGDSGLKLTRIDHRPNLERPDGFCRYGFAQMSVIYLQSQIIRVEEAGEPSEGDGAGSPSDTSKDATRISENEIDIRSCVQFVLDLFSQWILPNSGITFNVQLSMIKSILCISDLFLERTHFEWMLDVFLDLSKTHTTDDEIILQYLVIGIAKSSAVLGSFEGEKGEKILKVMESAVKSPFLPMREAGIYGLLYLLQGLLNIEKPAEEGESQKLRPYDFRLRVLQMSFDCIENNLGKELFGSKAASTLIISLTFYLMEYYSSEVSSYQELVKLLSKTAKTCGNGEVYLCVLHGFERLILMQQAPNLNEQVTRLSLERFSQSDPNITIPALQLLLACIYADTKNNREEKDDSEPWTIEIMEKVTALFDRIKKGYPIEVEIICDILPGILSDFFSASDILTKVLGEFLSPNQPHKRNMAAIVFQVFSQACDEQQLPLLQDWVVYSLNNLTHNLPLMMAGWSLCCFFISASINPWLKAIFPLVQSRIRQCEYEDRQILCLAAVDFYSQLSPKQKEIFLESLKGATTSQHTPFTDIIACL